MKHGIIIFIIFVFSCCGYDYKITNLELTELNFNELPVAVQEFIIKPPKLDNFDSGNLRIVNLQEADRYVLEVVFNKLVSSWVDYRNLLDTKSKTVYRLNRGIPRPLFVYENKLYVPDRYGIFYYVDKFDEVKFTCYTLK